MYVHVSSSFFLNPLIVIFLEVSIYSLLHKQSEVKSRSCSGFFPYYESTITNSCIKFVLMDIAGFYLVVLVSATISSRNIGKTYAVNSAPSDQNYQTERLTRTYV